MPNLDIRISQNGYARGWYWEVVSQDLTVLGRGLAETHAAAKAQAEDCISVLPKALPPLPPQWQRAS